MNKKKLLKFVTMVQGQTKFLSFDQRYCYSVLVCHPSGCNLQKLVKLTRLEQYRTLPKVLEVLISKGLVLKTDNTYCAIGDSKITTWGTKDNLFESVAYTRFLYPSDCCPLSKLTLAVYFGLLHVQDSEEFRFCPAGLAGLLNISRDTVYTNIKQLVAIGLLLPADKIADIRAVPVDQLPKRQQNWFIDADLSRKPAGNLLNLAEDLSGLIDWFRKSENMFVSTHNFNDEFIKFGQAAKSAGYNYKSIYKLIDRICKTLKYSVPIWRVLREFNNVIKDVETDTKRNIKYGKFKGTSSIGLFTKKINDLITKEKVKIKSEYVVPAAIKELINEPPIVKPAVVTAPVVAAPAPQVIIKPVVATAPIVDPLDASAEQIAEDWRHGTFQFCNKYFAKRVVVSQQLEERILSKFSKDLIIENLRKIELGKVVGLHTFEKMLYDAKSLVDDENIFRLLEEITAEKS